jgi:hypothetical protein
MLPCHTKPDFPRNSGNPVQGLSLHKESGVYSVLLFLAEFLESGIGAQRVPE